tara:strand:+ start:38 stop:250 length:213 start_codon:yes stop_codon:yes gene_type:complete
MSNSNYHNIPDTIARLKDAVEVLTHIAYDEPVGESDVVTSQGAVEDAITTLEQVSDEMDQAAAKWGRGYS